MPPSLSSTSAIERMRRGSNPTVLIVTAALALGGCVTSSDIEGLQAQLSDIQRQVLLLQQQASSKEEVADLGEKITQQTNALLKSEAEMLVGLEELSNELEQLRASLDNTDYRLEQLSAQITSTNQELQAVRSSIGGAFRSSVTPAEPANVGDPRELYQAAYNDHLSGNYDLAIMGFRRYLDAYPETDLADNAAYWIGEAYFSQRKYSQSIQAFDTILQRYARSEKIASALLKKGYAYLELGQREQGVAQLRSVIRQYPESDEANLARQRLDNLSG